MGLTTNETSALGPRAGFHSFIHHPFSYHHRPSPCLLCSVPSWLDVAINSNFICSVLVSTETKPTIMAHKDFL